MAGFSPVNPATAQLFSQSLKVPGLKVSMYFTAAQLVAFLPDAFQTDGLDDAGTGTADAFSVVQTEACGEIDGVLGSRYTVPFDTTGLPGLEAFLRSLSLQIAREIIFERRGRELNKNQSERLRDARKRLDRIAAGSDPLSPKLEPVAAPGALISEPSLSHGSGLSY